MKSSLDKVKKALGPQTLEELDALSPEQLKSKVVEANQAMEQVAKELEANPAYQDLKDKLNDVTQAKKDVNKRQRAIIQYSLARIANEA